MKNKIFITLISLLSTVCFANVTSSTYVNQLTIGQVNAYTDIFSDHTYYIYNDSGVDQTVSVCYSTIACLDAPQYKKEINSCDQVTIPNGGLKSNTVVQDLKAIYPFVGYCDVQTYTAIYGWQGNVSGAQGKLEVVNNKKKR